MRNHYGRGLALISQQDLSTRSNDSLKKQKKTMGSHSIFCEGAIVHSFQILKLYKKIRKIWFYYFKKFYMKIAKNQILKKILNMVILVKDSVVFSG